MLNAGRAYLLVPTDNADLGRLRLHITVCIIIWDAYLVQGALSKRRYEMFSPLCLDWYPVYATSHTPHSEHIEWSHRPRTSLLYVAILNTPKHSLWFTYECNPIPRSSCGHIYIT
jgi:hypothetical protein